MYPIVFRACQHLRPPSRNLHQKQMRRENICMTCRTQRAALEGRLSVVYEDFERGTSLLPLFRPSSPPFTVQSPRNLILL